MIAGGPDDMLDTDRSTAFTTVLPQIQIAEIGIFDNKKATNIRKQQQ